MEARRAQLLERGERELHLPLDSDRPDEVEVCSRFDRIVEQRRLADARLAVHGEHTAVSFPCRLQQAAEHLALALPAEQLRGGCPRYHSGSMPPGGRTTGFRDAIAQGSS